MGLKNAPFYYRATPTPSFDSHGRQDTITSDVAQPRDSEVALGGKP